MPSQPLVVIINGYGVPEDIKTDRSYHAYLIQILNWLWERHRTHALTIVPCGGRTDCTWPYRRTEADEMAKWLRPRIATLRCTSRWHLRPLATELSALENMLACAKRYPSGRMIYFCEQTRVPKMRVLAPRIFGNRVQVRGIEFDGSPPRYDRSGRLAHEREDLAFSLTALEDPQWRRELRAAARRKIQVLRTTSPEVRATEIDRIARRIRTEFHERYVRSQTKRTSAP